MPLDSGTLIHDDVGRFKHLSSKQDLNFTVKHCTNRGKKVKKSFKLLKNVCPNLTLSYLRKYTIISTNNLFGRSFFEVLNQIRHLVVVILVLLLDSLGSTRLTGLQSLGVFSQFVHALGAELVQDLGDQLEQLLGLHVAAHDIGVRRRRCLDCKNLTL